MDETRLAGRSGCTPAWPLPRIAAIRSPQVGADGEPCTPTLRVFRLTCSATTTSMALAYSKWDAVVGGNLLAASRWFQPRVLIGLDLSGVAAKWVGGALGDAGVVGVQGDAEYLPIRANGIDAVVCVESAAHYPDRIRFYSEVASVLPPGGVFYYAEGMPHSHLAPVAEALELAGFDLDRCDDLSDRVAAHWRRTVDARRRGHRRDAPAMKSDELAQVGGDENSALGQFLVSESMGYYLMALHRSDRADRSDSVPLATRSLLRGDGVFARDIMDAFSRGSWLDRGDAP
jgi:SAM-dependent methyltransferase